MLIKKNTRELAVFTFMHLNIEHCISTEKFPEAIRRKCEILIIFSVMSLSNDHFVRCNLFTLLHNFTG